MAQCPLCAGAVLPAAQQERIEREISLRDEFVAARFARKPDAGELKDLTDFMHGFPAPLTNCPRCSVFLREEQDTREAHTYEEDANDWSWMRHVLPRYVQAFRNKAGAYRHLLRPHAEVLELGPHLGAFLQVAEDWHWRPMGIDIGKDTAEFCNNRGLLVRRQTLEEGCLQPRTFDAVFIWNCFEQLADPGAALLAVHKILKPNGLLVVRVPNASFYESFAETLGRGKHSHFAAQALAYNNLLGFPYLYGYTPEGLDQIVAQNGFVYTEGFNSELVTMPFADVTPRIKEEQLSISRKVGQWSTAATAESRRLTGPWIEMVFRKLTTNDWRRRHERGPEAARQRMQRRIKLQFLRRAA